MGWKMNSAAAGSPELVDDSNPCIHVDMSQCIHCFRCVRICEEVAGRFVWKAWNRGDRTEIRPAGGVSLAESGCVSCGACVDTCPSGALRDTSALHRSRRPPRSAPSVRIAERVVKCTSVIETVAWFPCGPCSMPR